MGEVGLVNADHAEIEKVGIEGPTDGLVELRFGAGETNKQNIGAVCMGR